MSVPVRVERSGPFSGATLVPAGDVAISDLVEDGQQRSELEHHIEIGGGSLHLLEGAAVPTALLDRMTRLRHFAQTAAAAAGFPATTLAPADAGPDQLVRVDGLRIVAGVGVYAIHQSRDTGRAGSLRAWASGPLDRWSAFHSLYLDGSPPPPPPRPATVDHEGDDEVSSPFLLTPVQRQVVRRSRSEPVVLVSGAPGTGKSHTVVAIACDALARGESVLVTAKSDATVDALLDLLERAPGPVPVVFGSNERRDALAAGLAGGQLQPLSDHDVRSRLDKALAARRLESEATARMVDRLGAEVVFSQGRTTDERSRRLTPALFGPGTDLDDFARRFAQATGPVSGWWRRWRQRRLRRALWSQAGCAADTTAQTVEVALGLARAERAAAELAAAGGLALGSSWDELRHLGDAARDAAARWLAAEARSARRLNRSTLPAVAAVATALRSGRAARREQLSRIADDKLTRALPLWVGSLPDIDELLPPIVGCFDLVILDEASSIDQPLAAAALLRGRRGVVVGDPRQLRHVSFLADERLTEVVERHRLADRPLLASRLDVRRNSAFDVAAAATPVLTLDEHFRSDPHLIDFVASRLYDGSLRVATRAPSTVSKDCVDVVRLDGRRDRNGVVTAEVDRTLAELKRLRAVGEGSVGVITPFRAQADALEAAVMAAFTIDDLEALDLRIGTVHSFQGNERDHVIASIGVGPDEDGTTWRFVEDPHLFTVLVTRARNQMTVLVSADPPPGGLVADYLGRADAPPGLPPSRPPRADWTRLLADDLRAGGATAITSFPTGRHLVDLCIPGLGDVSVECDVDPDGPEAHVSRHLALARLGWEIVDAYPSRWADRRGELVVDLLRRHQAHQPNP